MVEIACPDVAHVADSLTVLGVGSTAHMPVVQLADLRAHLNWPSSKGTEDDAELLAMAGACEDTIEGYLGGRPVRTTQVAERHSATSAPLLLRRVPCPCGTCSPYRTLTVDSVTVDGVALAATGYTLDPDSGVLYRGTTTGQAWLATSPSGIVVTYTTGYTSPPSWAVLAVKRLVEHLWQGSQQSRHTRTAGDQGERAAAPVYLLPYMVQSLLNPHRACGW